MKLVHPLPAACPLSPRSLVWSARLWAAQTVPMAKRKPQTGKRAAKPAGSPREVQPPIPGMEAWAEQFTDPVLSQDPIKVLQAAMEAVGMDPAKPIQPGGKLFGGLITLQMAFDPVTARTDRSEQLALVVAHAEDARKLAASKPRTMQELQQLTDQLRQKVRATLCLRRAIKPPADLPDDRRPLFMDAEIIGLVGPDDDARSALVTLKLPRVIVDRLRDAVCALQPSRTMAGIASLGITQVLDVLEAHYLLQTGRRFPARPVEVLTGGRPSRTTATSAAKPPTRTKPGKRGNARNKNP